MIEIRSSAGVTIAARRVGPAHGRAIVLMHGLTMTSDQLLMATAGLDRLGYRVVAYDARGHGRSSAPDDPAAYGCAALAQDALSVMDALEIERAVLVGASMGAHTALRIALDAPGRVAAVAAITPGFDPAAHRSSKEWSELALALRLGGPEAFAAALRLPGVDPERAAVIRNLTRAHLSQHRDLWAVADALESVPRDRPFESLDELASIRVPALVVASRDDFDRAHPYAVADAYADAMLGCAFACEPPGALPLAWGGRELTSQLGKLAAQAAWGGAIEWTGA